MADFKTSSTSVKWYNVLSFHFMQTEVKKVSPSPKPVGHSVNNHMKQESEISTMTNSRQGTLKEESSDESTIISSQTSTLTRNMGPESMMGHCDSPDTGCMAHPEFGIDGITVQVEDDEEEDEPDEDSEDFMINENTVSVNEKIRRVEKSKEWNHIVTMNHTRMGTSTIIIISLNF